MIKTNLKKVGIEDERLSQVKCPIGLELGGKSPQELAISIAAEVLRTFHEKESI